MAIPAKFAAALFAALALVSSLRAEEGTLTLSGDKVLFVTASGTKKYTLELGGPVLEGTKVSAFTPKKITKDDKETDISELTLVNTADGSTFVLVNLVPLPVVRSGSGESSVWKPQAK